MLGDAPGHLAGAVEEDEARIVIAVRVEPVRDELACEVALSFFRAPAVADIGADLENAERREVAVLDAGIQAVRIEGLAEVVDIGDVAGLLRRGGHADLGGAAEVVEDAPPAAVLLGGAAVAFVDDDEVEEIRPEEVAEVLLVVIAHELLVQGEIHLIGGERHRVLFGGPDLVGDLPERGEVLLDGLVHEDISVCEIEHLFDEARREQAVDDLEGRIGLAGAGGHDEKDALAAAGDGVHGAVHGDALVVPRGKGVRRDVVGLTEGLFLPVGEPFALIDLAAPAGGELRLGGEAVQRQVPLEAGEVIVFGEAVPVGAVGKGEVEHFCVELGLLEPVGDGVAVVLGLNDGNGVLAVEVEEVVHLFCLLPRDETAAEQNFSVGDLRLHGDLVPGPAAGERGRDELELDVLLGHFLFGQYGAHAPASFEKFFKL